MKGLQIGRMRPYSICTDRRSGETHHIVTVGAFDRSTYSKQGKYRETIQVAQPIASCYPHCVLRPTPMIQSDYRPEDQIQAVPATCSGLLSVVKADDLQVIDFSHFSARVYLMSVRFSNS